MRRLIARLITALRRPAPAGGMPRGHPSGIPHAERLVWSRAITTR